MSHKIIRLNIDIEKKEQSFEVPMFSNPLCVGVDRDREHIDIMIDEDEKLTETLRIRMYKTGESFERDEHDNQYYLGSTYCLFCGTTYERHVFVVYNTEESS